MTEGIKTILYPVKDIAQARELFRLLLGVEPTADESYYVGFNVAGQHIGLNPQGHAQGMTGPVGYYHVDDMDRMLDALTAAGAQAQEIKEVGGGRKVVTVIDPDGNAIGLLQDS